MIIGEVKEGHAEFNENVWDAAVLRPYSFGLVVAHGIVLASRWSNLFDTGMRVRIAVIASD